jgi:hypothetical protein
MRVCGRIAGEQGRAQLGAELHQLRIVAAEVRAAVIRVGARFLDRTAGGGREVEIEDRVEGRAVGLPLDQRGRVCGAKLLAVDQLDDAEGRHSIDVLGDRHVQPGTAQRGDEGNMPVEQGHSFTAGRSSSLIARA